MLGVSSFMISVTTIQLCHRYMETTIEKNVIYKHKQFADF